MIRRQIDDQFFLIAQHEHALLAGRLASHYGNAFFDRPDPAPEVIEAVCMHDSGWQAHDRAPTLNAQGLPHDVFETPLEIALAAWGGAGDCVADLSPYTRLIVSLHVMGLSGYAAAHATDRRAQFDINRFQHAEAERQEILRPQLGLRLNIPLKLGLSVLPGIPDEEQLRRNHMVLQAMDRLSLAVCCTGIPFPSIEQIVPREGARGVTLQFSRTGEWAIRVDPWPFDQQHIRLPLAARRLPARPYAPDEFAAVYPAAALEEINVDIHS